MWKGYAATDPVVVDLPEVVLPNREFWLFRGPLADVGAWESARGWPGRPRIYSPEPAFVWPSDRQWCVANDVDPHWAGIGGRQSLIDELVADERLDVVRADPAEAQPYYR